MPEHSQNVGIVNSVGGHQVCETCFRKVYEFRYHRFVAMKAKFHNGIFVAEHGRTGRCEITNSSIRVIIWLRTFSKKVGDRMPTSSAIHLPSCLTKADVYTLML